MFQVTTFCFLCHVSINLSVLDGFQMKLVVTFSLLPMTPFMPFSCDLPTIAMNTWIKTEPMCLQWDS